MFFLSDSSSENSSDEDNKHILRIQRKVMRQKLDLYNLPDSKFIEYFRLNKEVFKYIVEKVEPFMKDGARSTCIPNTLKLAATLLFLGQGSFQLNVGNDFNLGLSQSSVSVVLEETLDVIERIIFPLFVKFKITREEENEIKSAFLKQTGFPDVIGCIDGTHIKILAPCKEQQSLYTNIKGFFSLNALVICDHKMRIRFIDARISGSYNDSEVWNISLAKQALHKRYESGERNFWILGDSDYPLEPYLMTPYMTAKDGTPEAVYNNRHEQSRRIIEKTIDALKNRFRCLHGDRQLHYKPAKATKITNVCAALHNVCIKYNSIIDSDNTMSNTYESKQNIIENDNVANFQNTEAFEIRERIKEIFCK